MKTTLSFLAAELGLELVGEDREIAGGQHPGQGRTP